MKTINGAGFDQGRATPAKPASSGKHLQKGEAFVLSGAEMSTVVDLLEMTAVDEREVSASVKGGDGYF